jgi:hypothetical protein
MYVFTASITPQCYCCSPQQLGGIFASAQLARGAARRYLRDERYLYDDGGLRWNYPPEDDEFTPLAEPALRKACRKAGLSASGEADELRARLREGEEAARRSRIRDELLKVAMVDATALGGKTLEESVDKAIELEEDEKDEVKSSAAEEAFFNGADNARVFDELHSTEHWKTDGSGSIHVPQGYWCNGKQCPFAMTVSREEVRTSLEKEKSECEEEEGE